MAGRTTRSDSSMAIDALKDAEVGSVLTFFVAYLYLYRFWDDTFAVHFFSGAIWGHVAAWPETKNSPADGASVPGPMKTFGMSGYYRQIAGMNPPTISCFGVCHCSKSRQNSACEASP